jgi:hypothetical protein
MEYFQAAYLLRNWTASILQKEQNALFTNNKKTSTLMLWFSVWAPFVLPQSPECLAFRERQSIMENWPSQMISLAIYYTGKVTPVPVELALRGAIAIFFKRLAHARDFANF